MTLTKNSVTIRGYLGDDPEIRHFQSGGRVANLSVSTSESWTDRQTGERRERTEWHRVAVFNDPAISYLERQKAAKGDMVEVEGKLETRKWQDQNGNDRWSTEIAVRPYSGDLTVIRTKASPMSSDPDGQRGAAAAEGGQEGAVDFDDEIPF